MASISVLIPFATGMLSLCLLPKTPSRLGEVEKKRLKGWASVKARDEAFTNAGKR